MVAVQKEIDSELLYCDPMITANIYCLGLTDRLIYSCIRPFWKNALSDGGERPLRMWLMRYRRCGPHLKVRIHGPESAKASIKELLQNSVEDFFLTLDEDEKPLSPDYQIGAGDIPIDVEDDGESNYPNCSLLWTNYRRSFVSLGSLPFMEDDRYVEYFTRCLSQGSELVLRDYGPNKNGQFTNTSRQLILLRALIEGLEALGFVGPKSIEYLSYHRDWLLRFAIFKSKTNISKAPEIIHHFEKRSQAMNAFVAVLKPLVQTHLTSSTQPRDRKDQTAWQDSLRTLMDYVSPFCASEDYRVDPYASDPIFPAPFKVFHGLANQLGLLFLEEAFGHHLLLSCLASEV